MRTLTPSCLLPTEEAQRLRSLRAHQLQHAPPERVFAALVAVSAHVFGLPVSLLAIVEAEEVFYRATYGLPDLRRYPRAETLCALTIQQNTSVIFCDVAQAHHALLTDAMRAAVAAHGVHFYAGALLRLPDTQAVGTLCVVGYQPRPFSVGEQHLLEQLAQVLGQLLAARQTCMTTPALGWAHWQVVEEQLAEQVRSLGTWLEQRRVLPGLPLATVPPRELAQVRRRLQVLHELLQEYQPPSVLHSASVTLSA
jgi:GAF domain-containing protein